MSDVWKNSKGKLSSKRVSGLIGMIYLFLLTGLDGFAAYEVNETIVISGMAICAALLGLDSVTDIWKKQ